MKQGKIKSRPSATGGFDLASRFRRPGIHWARWVAFALTTALVACIFGLGDVGEYLKTRLDLPLLYRAREAAGRGPELSKKIRILLFDDSAMSWLGVGEPSLSQWVDVIDAISARKPKAIIINKVFGILPNGSNAGDATEFVKSLQAIRERDHVPVVAGAYFSQSDNAFRNKISASSVPSLGPASWGLDAAIPVPAQLASLKFFSKDNSTDYLYGPDPKLLPAFSGIGAVDYLQNMMVPAASHGRDNSLVPNIMIAGFGNRSPGNGFILVNGFRVPVNHQGEMLPNTVARKKIAGSAISLKHFLDPATRKVAAAATLVADDVVFIGFSTSVDAADSAIPTPLGLMPASFAIAAIGNSLVTGEFITGAPFEPLWWFSGGLIGLLLAIWFPVSTGLLALAGASVIWTAVCTCSFVFGGMAVPWLVPVVSIMTGGWLVISRKANLGRTNAITVAAAFDGRVSNESMKSMAQHPERMDLACREVSISIMFIDIAGFSLFSERRGAQEVFDYLRDFLADVSKSVLEHKGVIDKSLGDGLLAYFGQEINSNGEQLDHAVRAFDCALKIQRDHLQRNEGALGSGLPVLPVRIGLNSSTCLLGDLGTEKRMDITIVGGGVNFAKRLEDACDPGTILISSTTFSLAMPDVRNSGFVRKFVRMKHMNALVEAFEFDPLASQPQLKVKLMDAFRKTVAIERVDRRWVVPHGKSIIFTNELGSCELVNFSGRGFAARLPALFARGSRFVFEIENEGLRQKLSGCDISKIDAEVRSCHGSGGNIVHGFLINGFSEEQSAAFNRVLLEYSFSDDEFKLPRIG